ncbi:MAG: ArsR family transcriptional regulator, partial [Candidatus Helarchaeota archaeon]
MDKTSMLDKTQKKVYNFITRFYSENDIFSIHDLIIECKRALNLNEKKIYDVIKKLIDLDLIIEIHPFNKELVLENSERLNIYQYISKNPGIKFEDIFNEFNLNPKIIRWHLEILKYFEYIRENNYLIYTYFHKYFPKEKDIIVYLLKDSDLMDICLLLQNQSLDIKSLSEILDIPVSIIGFHLYKLLKSNIIIRKGDEFSLNTDSLKGLEPFFDFKMPENLQNKLVEYIEFKKILLLIIIYKESGILIYQHNFLEMNIDADLISGFLTAIQQFG